MKEKEEKLEIFIPNGPRLGNLFLSGINTNSVPVQGTAIGDAIITCAQSFSMEGMQEKGNKAIIVISDGENHEDDAVQAAAAAK